jgi:hypothetical protein
MMADPGPGASQEAFSDRLYAETLPGVRCSACGEEIARRGARVTLRASWRKSQEYLCVECWSSLITWAASFALRQLSPGLEI